MASWFILLPGILLTACLFLCEGLNTSGNGGRGGLRKIFNESKICNTKECRQVANAFVESMNKSVNPCDDFYEFACGNWESKNPAPKYESKWHSIRRFQFLAETRLRDELESEPSSEDIAPIQYVKKLYASCMNNETRESEGLQKISAILQETKGWPMAMNTWSSEAITWQEIDDYHETLIGIRALFYIDTEPDVASKWIRLIVMMPIFPLEDKRLMDYTSDEVVEYRSVIKKIARLFIQQNGEEVSDEKLDKDINDLLKFEETLFELESESSRARVENTSQLANLFDGYMKSNTSRGQIEWERILQNSYNIAKPPITNDTCFVAFDSKYLNQLAQILDSTDERTIVNYIQWQFISLILPYTTEEVNDILDKMSGSVLGFQERPPGWLQCVRDAATADAGSYSFARKYYPNKSKAAVDELIRNMKKSLGSLMNNSNWLPIGAKHVATEKLNTMLVLTGYPEWYNNETALINFYENLTMGTSYIENVLKTFQREWLQHIKLWGQPADKYMFLMNVVEVDAGYFEELNMINIPAAILQLPLFDDNMPDYVSYGIIGHTIGHEISHGFDMDGMAHEVAPRRTLFADDVPAMYRRHVQCFVETFDKYFGNNTENNRNQSSRGELKLRENLADWSGVQAAFHAYKEIQDNVSNEKSKLPGLEEFTDEQMFFISYAQIWCEAKPSETYTKNVAMGDTHAPDKLRVIGPLSNLLAFAETFNCPKNSPMNPEKKCNIWTNSRVASS